MNLNDVRLRIQLRDVNSAGCAIVRNPPEIYQLNVRPICGSLVFFFFRARNALEQQSGVDTRNFGVNSAMTQVRQTEIHNSV